MAAACRRCCSTGRRWRRSEHRPAVRREPDSPRPWFSVEIPSQVEVAAGETVKRFSERRRRVIGLLSALLLSALAATGIAAGARAQAPNEGLPIPDSPQHDLTAIDRLFRPPPPPPLALFPRMREEMRNAPAVVRESTWSIDPRSYYRDQATAKSTGTTISEAWAGGGSLAFETGRLFDVVSFGTVVYATFPLYAPLDRGNTGLLQPDQAGFAVAGQLYGRARLAENTYFTAGRYLYDTPYLGPQDNRMIPNTFYGYSLTGSLGDAEHGASLRYGGGYIATIKPRDSATFLSMSRQAGANVDNGVGVAGGRFTWGPASIGAIEYYAQDTLNIAYAEGKYGAHLPWNISAILAVQYADQRTVGANLTNGGTSYQTSQFGSRLEFGGLGTGILSLGFSTVNPAFAMMNPWSSNPIYTDAQIQSFQRAGESALMAGLSYVMTPIGLPGVAASVFYYNGWTTAAAAGGPLTESEWDFKLEWRPSWKPLLGLWIRAQYGSSATEQNNKRTTVDEVRLVLNYTLNIY
jgi:hypothetical protein